MMHLPLSKPIFMVLVALSLTACGALTPSSNKPAAPPPEAATLLPNDATTLLSDDAATETTIRFLEDRVKRDFDDFVAYNKLAGLYLQRQRETGDANYIALADRASLASLAAIPAEQNAGGLAALAQVAYASHDFAAARDHAMRLTKLDSRKSYPYQILGDALLELGEYEKAEGAFRQMTRLGGTSVESETRLARLASLYGRTEATERHLSTALTLALDLFPVPRETIAWCHWQLGETKFARGDYEAAERHYRDSLTTFPDYFRALASLGRARAARGDLAGGIEHYERAVRRYPDPVFVAALGDLYKLSGREGEAAAQYRLVEQIARLKESGTLYDRQLALFYADHDMNREEAYASAVKEYEARQDIYGADAVAWTALKAGKLNEAQTAMKEALRLNTKDARLYYHAGMIAHRAGDANAARDYLNRALTISPRFDPLQAALARQTLDAL